jgi:hypothetical protein
MRWHVVLAASIAVVLGDQDARTEERGSTARTVVTFEDAEVGRPPPGFTMSLTGEGVPVSWLVREDATAPSGEKVLVQTSADPTNHRFPHCVFDAFSTEDVSLAVRFKTLSGEVDQAAGLVWRYRDPSNYYLVRANALEGNVVLYKVANGKRSDLKPVDGGLFAYGKDAEVEAHRWHTLKFDADGPRFRVTLDDVFLFDVEDSTFRGPGKVGLWTKADSVTAFDDFVVEPRASPPEPAETGSAASVPPA